MSYTAWRSASSGTAEAHVGDRDIHRDLGDQLVHRVGRDRAPHLRRRLGLAAEHARDLLQLAPVGLLRLRQLDLVAGDGGDRGVVQADVADHVADAPQVTNIAISRKKNRRATQEFRWRRNGDEHAYFQWRVPPASVAPAGPGAAWPQRYASGRSPARIASYTTHGGQPRGREGCNAPTDRRQLEDERPVRAMAAAIAAPLRAGAASLACDLLVCPPATLIAAVAQLLAGSPVAVGGAGLPRRAERRAYRRHLRRHAARRRRDAG